MHIRLRIATFVALGLIAASCSAAPTIDEADPSPSKATDAPVQDAAAGASDAFATEDVEIWIRRDALSPQSADLRPQTASLLIPENLDSTAPVVVLLHGAGATRHSMDRMAKAIAARGVPVLNADWPANPTFPIPAAADAVCAVAYAYQNASSWGADPQRIIVMGHSGGGHVGSIAALAPELVPECPMAADAHVWAYVSLAGDPSSAAPGGTVYEFWKDKPEILAVMDATRHIGGNPDLIARFIHGTADEIVKIERTIAVSEAFIDAGYDSIHIPVEGAGHQDPADPATDAGVAVLRVLEELIELHFG